MEIIPTLDVVTAFFFPWPIRLQFLIVFGIGLFYRLGHVLKSTAVNTAALMQMPQESAELTMQCRTLTLTFGLLYAFNWTIFRLFRTFESILYGWLLFLFALACPFAKSTRAARYQFIYVLKRVVLGSGVGPVYFCDVVLADVLTSYAKVLADWDALLFCSFLRVPDFHAACLPSLFSVFVVCLPFLCRLRQCLAEYFLHGPDQQRHLFNALKYMSSFPVIYLSYLIAFPVAGNITKAAWTAALIVNCVFSCYWDVCKDWDLISGRNAKAKPYYWVMRTPLLFSGPAVYLFAMAVNTAIRGLWIFRFYAAAMHPSTHSSVLVWEGAFGILLSQALEVARRMMWIAFRLEAQAYQQTLHQPLSFEPFIPNYATNP